MRIQRIGVTVVSMLLLLSTRAFADPIVITGGTANAAWDGSYTFIELLGNGTHIADSAGGGWSLTPMSPGVLRPYLTSSPFDLPFQQLSQTINGVRYSPVFLTGEVKLLGDPFTLPPAVGTGADFSTPFTMTGHIAGYANWDDAHRSGPPLFPPLFSVDLVGSGTMFFSGRVVRDENGRPYWIFSQSGATGRFSDPSPSPTPEPATMLLFATGLAAASRKIRLRRF